MSLLSPFEQAANERSRNRRAIGTYIFVTAVVFSAIWIGRDSIFPNATVTRETITDREPAGSAASPTIDANDRTASNSNADLAAQIESIKNELPRDDSAETRDLILQLDRLLRELESRSVAFEPDSAQTIKIEQTLATIRQRVIRFRTESSIPAVGDSDIDARVSNHVQEVKRAERIESERMVAAARRTVGDEKASELRKVRLELRDRQDQIKLLQHQITSKQSELKSRREKQQRTDALNADMADVRAYLSPFITPGVQQPSNSAKIWDTTSEVKPVSLRRLKEKKALEPNARELATFYMLGGEIHPAFNRRPLGSFPAYREGNLKNPEVMAVVKRAQQLIRDHREALVEAGLLSE